MHDPTEATQPATPEEAAETRRSVRLVGLVCLVAVVIYGLVAAAMSPDAELVQRGRHQELHFVVRDLAHMDRDARWGERPVVWLMGSSIVREAFDASRMADALARGGLPWGVEKVSFNRGAQVFQWAILDEVDLRPGDVAITLVTYDNFRTDWLAFHGDFEMHVQFLMEPDEIARVATLSWAEKAEYSLAAVPPRQFHRQRTAFHDGFEARVEQAIGHRKRLPGIARHVSFQPFTQRRKTGGFRNLRRLWRYELTDELMELETGQVNWDGLQAWIAEVRERGADPVVIYVPHNAEFYDRFVTEPLVRRFHATMEASVPEYVRLSPIDGEQGFLDYKHPNYVGRAWFSDELADWLLVREDRPPNRDHDGPEIRVLPGEHRIVDLYGYGPAGPPPGAP